MTVRGKFRVDVYNCYVYVFYTDQIIRSVNFFCNKFGWDKIKSAVEGYVVPGNLDYYLFVSKEHCSVDTINHEKSHVVDFILQERSIKSKDEVRAYLDGYVSRRLNKFFKKHKIKIKN